MFHLARPQISSSDEEAASPVLGASSSKDPPPPLNSVASDDDDELPDQRRRKSHSRPRIEWQEVLKFEKGARAIMGEDQMKLEIAQAYNKIMDDSRMVRLPGHVPAPTDCGLWKLKRETMVDYAQWLIVSVVRAKSKLAMEPATVLCRFEASIMRIVMRRTRTNPSI